MNGTVYYMVDINVLHYFFINDTKNIDYNFVRKSTILYNIKKNMQEEA
jgi:hypothetical protein